MSTTSAMHPDPEPEMIGAPMGRRLRHGPVPAGGIAHVESAIGGVLDAGLGALNEAISNLNLPPDAPAPQAMEANLQHVMQSGLEALANMAAATAGGIAAANAPEGARKKAAGRPPRTVPAEKSAKPCPCPPTRAPDAAVKKTGVAKKMAAPSEPKAKEDMNGPQRRELGPIASKVVGDHFHTALPGVKPAAKVAAVTDVSKGRKPAAAAKATSAATKAAPASNKKGDNDSQASRPLTRAAQAAIARQKGEGGAATVNTSAATVAGLAGVAAVAGKLAQGARAPAARKPAAAAKPAAPAPRRR